MQRGELQKPTQHVSVTHWNTIEAIEVPVCAKHRCARLILGVREWSLMIRNLQFGAPQKIDIQQRTICFSELVSQTHKSHFLGPQCSKHRCVRLILGGWEGVVSNGKKPTIFSIWSTSSNTQCCSDNNFCNEHKLCFGSYIVSGKCKSYDSIEAAAETIS